MFCGRLIWGENGDPQKREALDDQNTQEFSKSGEAVYAVEKKVRDQLAWEKL